MMNLSKIFIGFLLFFTFETTLQAQDPQRFYDITRIVDGDTIQVMKGSSEEMRVRLAGIDAPERDQRFGRQARLHLEKLLKDKSVALDILYKDYFGRSVAIVLLKQRDINLRMISDGFAWAFRKYLRDLPPGKGSIYLREEKIAKHQKLGLWSLNEPISPWQFRRKKRE